MKAPEGKPRQRPLIGVFLMMCGTMLLPGIDLLSKLAILADTPIIVVSTGRFSVQAACFLLVGVRTRGLHRPGLREAPWHVLRGGLICFAHALFTGALRHMPIADAACIFFSEPLILTLLGALLLHEHVRRGQVVACVCGFGGACLVIQPSYKEVGWPALLPLGTALCYALYVIVTRHMRQHLRTTPHGASDEAAEGARVAVGAGSDEVRCGDSEAPGPGSSSPGPPPQDIKVEALQAYTALGALSLLVPAMVVGRATSAHDLRAAWPEGLAWVWVLACGAVATGAHFLMTWALGMAPASLVAPMQYFEIVGATCFDLIFGDVPDNWMVAAGAMVVIASGVYIAWSERHQELRDQNDGDGDPVAVRMMTEEELKQMDATNCDDNWIPQCKSMITQ